MSGPAKVRAATPPIFVRYWHAYGGVKAVCSSLYFWCSILITIACFNIWTKPGWWDSVLSILPNLLGFSLGGFALWLAIGDDQFRKLIAKRTHAPQYTPYAQINASFVHFIVLQVSAIVCALIAKGLDFQLPATCWLIQNFREEFYFACGVGAFVGFLLFVYAILSALAATLGLFQITFMYEAYLNCPPVEKKWRNRFDNREK